MESEEDYSKAIDILSRLKLDTALKSKKSEIIYYLLICYIKNDEASKVIDTFNEINSYNNSFTEKAKLIYDKYSRRKNFKSNLIIDINDDILKEIIDLGGSIKDYTQFQVNSISSDIYVKILQNKLSHKNFLDKFIKKIFMR